MSDNGGSPHRRSGSVGTGFALSERITDQAGKAIFDGYALALMSPLVATAWALAAGWPVLLIQAYRSSFRRVPGLVRDFDARRAFTAIKRGRRSPESGLDGGRGSSSGAS